MTNRLTPDFYLILYGPQDKNGFTFVNNAKKKCQKKNNISMECYIIYHMQV